MKLEKKLDRIKSLFRKRYFLAVFEAAPLGVSGDKAAQVWGQNFGKLRKDAGASLDIIANLNAATTRKEIADFENGRVKFSESCARRLASSLIDTLATFSAQNIAFRNVDFRAVKPGFSFDEADETGVFDALFFLSPGEIDASESPKSNERADEISPIYLKTRYEYRKRKLQTQIAGALLRGLPESGAAFSALETSKRFAANVVALRKSFDATQDELAEAAELSPGAIANLENGEYNLFAYTIFDALIIGFSRLYLFRSRFPFETSAREQAPTDKTPIFPEIFEDDEAA